MKRNSASVGGRQATRAAAIRQLITLHPEAMSFVALQEALIIEGYPTPDRELASDLDYLEQSGYVKLERLKPRLKPARITQISLTRKGMDLWERRLAPDPGVAL